MIRYFAFIMMVWYPGDKGGKAVAETIFGEYNPSGKLPITFPRHESQLPLVYNHRPTGRGDDNNRHKRRRKCMFQDQKHGKPQRRWYLR